jgi:uncharacterized protein Usg
MTPGKSLILCRDQLHGTQDRELHCDPEWLYESRMPEAALLRLLEGFSLTTAEILYRRPDYPRLLQSYIWQDYDLAPRFPTFIDFLDFWTANLDGPLYRVRVAHRQQIAPQFRFVDGELRLN